MLKCGQKDNKNYTFGVRKEQMEEEHVVLTSKIVMCSKCGKKHEGEGDHCPFCGEKL